MRICTFEGCDRKHYAKGLCSGHNYQRRKGQKLKKLKEYNKYKYCTWGNCKRPHFSRGLCRSHYFQKYIHKIKLKKIIVHKKRNMSLKEIVEYSWQHVTWNNNCLEYNVNSDNPNNYPHTAYKNKSTALGRVVLTYYIRKPKKGEIMQHNCDNRRCINPAHLSWSTTKENIRDMLKKNRGRNQYTGKLY